MTKFRITFCMLAAALAVVFMMGTVVFAEDLPEDTAAGDIDATMAAAEETGTGDGTDPTGETAEPVDINDSNVTIEDIPEQTWTGSAVKLDAEDLQVWFHDAETGENVPLGENVDFTTAYSNNVNVGTATVTLTGMGNYKGTRSENFKITKATEAPKPVKKVTCLAGCGAFKIVWKPNTDKDQVDYYYIERRKGGKVDRTRITSDDEIKASEWENAYKVKKKKKYTFTIYAVKVVGEPDTKAELDAGIGNDLKSEPMKTKATETADRRMVIKVTMKTTVGSLKSGKTYEATGFGSGQYKIPNKGHTYSIARYKVRNQKAIYVKRGELSHDAVNFFMNGGKTWAKATKSNKYKYSFVKKSKFSTSRTYWVWVNTYNQHVYVLKKSGSKWKCVDDWRCSMGTASTPSPMGMKTIIKYRAYHPGHGAPYWNFISWSNSAQHGTALHGLESGWASKLGTLASHGCVRNPSNKAKALHETYSGNGMKVYIW